MTPAELDQVAQRVAEVVVAALASRPAEGFIDAHAAAELLGCSKSTVERLTASKKIPSHKIGGSRRYLPSELLNRKGGAA